MIDYLVNSLRFESSREKSKIDETAFIVIVPAPTVMGTMDLASKRLPKSSKYFINPFIKSIEIRVSFLVK